MKTFQFTCAVRIEAPDTDWDGTLFIIPNMITPIIKADTMREAFRDPALIQFCADNKCTIYEVVDV